MAKIDAISELLEVLARLRDPNDGCPWDIKQDSTSIAPHTIEEAYEVADAIHRNDTDSLKDELGDLLFNVMYHAQIASESEYFDFFDVAKASSEKMIRRHPHVFGNERIKNAEEQEKAWNTIKSAERSEKESYITDDIPIGLAQLKRAQKIGKCVAKIGFDWTELDDVNAKIVEEISELEEAIHSNDQNHIEEEFGDVLFSLCNLARHLEIDAETALLKANNKFIARFNHVEESAKKMNALLDQLSPNELEQLWLSAKASQKYE